MKTENKKFEYLTIGLILIAAAGIRMANLGVQPLNDFEARWAFQAHEIAAGSSAEFGSNPAYTVLTSWLFSFFGSSAAAARFFPALLGSLLVLLPFGLRTRMDRTAALIFALGLAFDPGLVAVSRIAGGPMPALGFTILLVLSWLYGQMAWVGIFGALALLSGPAVWFGWAALFLGWMLYQLFQQEEATLSFETLRPAALPALITLVVVGGNFLRTPQGISSAALSLLEYFSGWTRLSPVPARQLLAALAVYQPLALIFGLLAIFRSLRQAGAGIRILQMLFGAALLAALVYPSHQVLDLVWALTALWGIAALEMARYFRRREVWEPRVTLVTFGITFLFLVFFWLNLAGLSAQYAYASVEGSYITHLFAMIEGTSTLDAVSRSVVFRVVLAFLVPLLIGLSVIMIGFGWSQEDSKIGFSWGVILFLAAYVYGVSNGAHLRAKAANELWLPGSPAGYPDKLVQTLDTLSEWNKGMAGELEVVVLFESPVLDWELRDYRLSRQGKLLGEEEYPQVVITPVSYANDPHLNAAYRGQSFPLGFIRGWETGLPQDFLRWFVFRDTVTYSNTVILWARADLFPGGSLDDGR
ncbi:MAG: hypothetical protein OEY93_03730 [Anaerolineae bacterium]|nr:hypothetical protein [Anaerolineae bacterium]